MFLCSLSVPTRLINRFLSLHKAVNFCFDYFSSHTSLVSTIVRFIRVITLHPRGEPCTSSPDLDTQKFVCAPSCSHYRTRAASPPLPASPSILSSSHMRLIVSLWAYVWESESMDLLISAALICFSLEEAVVGVSHHGEIRRWRKTDRPGFLTRSGVCVVKPSSCHISEFM